MNAQSNLVRAVLTIAGLIVLGVAPAAQALHWSIDVAVIPTQAEASRAIDMTIMLTNSGTMSTTAGSVTLHLPWYGNVTRSIHMDLVTNSILPGGCFPVRPVGVTAPAEPGIYPWTIDVEARTLGDSLAESKSYSGTLQVVASAPSVPSGATCLPVALPWLAGIIVAGVVATGVVVFVAMRRRKRGPQSGGRGRPPSPPEAP